MQGRLNTESKIQITLSVNEWNQVLTMLAKQPYELSAGLIQAISVQAANPTNQLPLSNGGLAPNAGNAMGSIEVGGGGA